MLPTRSISNSAPLIEPVLGVLVLTCHGGGQSENRSGVLLGPFGDGVAASQYAWTEKHRQEEWTLVCL